MKLFPTINHNRFQEPAYLKPPFYLMRMTTFSLLFLLMVACGRRSAEIEKLIDVRMAIHQDLKGRTLLFSKLRNINNNYHEKINGNKPIILVLIKPSCGDCYSSLEEWNGIIANNPLIKANCEVIFISSGETSDYLNQFVNSQDRVLNFPIYEDQNSSFIYSNKLTAYEKTTLLLNSDRSVMLVGSPLQNEKLMLAYYHLISRLN